MDLLKILPLALVMIAGPQIISSFLIATSPSWKKVSAAYALGAAISISLITAVGYLLTNGAGQGNEDGGSGLSTVDYLLIVLLLIAAAHTYGTRNQTEPPKWMGKLQTVTPKAAFALGFLLLGFFPSDLVTSFSVGGYLASHGDPYLDALPFVLLTVLVLSLPALLILCLGARAQALLPKVRDWMDQNAWIISEVVIVFFIALILSGG